MEKMTIHRGLAELKLIDSKINKQKQNFIPSGFMQPEKLVNNKYKKEDFEKEAKSKYQSIEDLFNRKIAIKKAIVEANSKTMVTIGKKTMSIADAINYKSLISQKEEYLDFLKYHHSDVKNNIESRNMDVEEKALKLTTEALSKDNSSAKTVVDIYKKTHEYSIVDPLGLDKVIEKMENEIDDFKSEIDAILSEINATTMIEI